MATATQAGKSIFLHALELSSPPDRRAYLDSVCGDDSHLRQEVEELLQHHDRAGEFLESPPTEIVAAVELTVGDTTGPLLNFLDPSTDAASLGRLGSYEVQEVIGCGGFGVVLKARDPKLDRLVAIKTLNPVLASSAVARQRFVREARTAAAVNHENIVSIYAVSDEGPAPWLVMECIAGVSLEEKLQQAGTLDVPTILRIGMQVASGLAAAHKQGLVHRDVKPGNILLENGMERVKITDFGLARTVDDVAITRTGEVAGTPQYMSPEQAQGQPVDQRSDLFSLGSVLYAMCTGHSPFPADSAIAILRRVCDDTPRPICEVNLDVPDWLGAIIDRLLAKQPEDRFQTAAEVAELLGRCLARLQHTTLLSLPCPPIASAPRPATLPAKRRRWLIVAMLLSLASGLIAVTEATGVTNLAGTVIRIATGEGTLVIAVEGPGVQVSLDGRELKISSAGIQELRLRPGQYQFEATRNGERVTRKLVTITRGGRQVVAVTLEPPAPAAGAKHDPAVEQITSFRRLAGHEVAVFDVACAPDGKQAVSIGGDGTLRIWDLEQGREVRTIHRDSRDMCRALSLSPNGRYIAIGGVSGLVFVFDLATGEELQKLTLVQPQVAATQFSPDSQRLVTGTLRDGIQLWDWPTGQEIRRFKGHGDGRHYELEFSRDGAQLLSASGDGTARLWDVETGQELHCFQGHTDEVYSATFSRDGRHAATSSADATIRLWDVASGRLLRTLHGHTHTVKRVRYLPDGRHLVSGADDKMIRFWNIAEGTEVARIKADTHVTSRLAVFPNGRTLLSAGGYAWDADAKRLRFDGDTAIRVWRLPEQLWRDDSARDVWRRPSPGAVYDLALSSDGQRAVACVGHLVFLFDPHTGERLQAMQGHEDAVRGIALSPDGQSVASGGHDATVRIWDTATGREIRRFETERIVDGGTGRPFGCVAYSPNGKFLLAGSRNDLLMWELESGELVRNFVGHTNAPRRVTFSPDGSLVASGGHDGTARVWRTETGELIHTLRDGSHWIVPVAFSPDGRLLATGGRRTVTAWDVETGRERWRFPIGEKIAEGITFTPDGRFLAAGIGFSPPDEGELVVLDALSGREIHRMGGLTIGVFDVKSTADGRGVFIAEGNGMRLVRLPESLWTTASTDIPEAGAFVVLTGKGIEFRKYATLAEAVAAANDGDTIEIRGNGPFVIQAMSLGKKSLTIRAATGYRPVIKGTALRTVESNPYLLHSQSTLVLEGLEIHVTGPENFTIVYSSRAPLHVANCRFVTCGTGHSLKAVNTLACTAHNCEFVGTSGGGHHLGCNLSNDGKLILNNNVISGPNGHALGLVWGRPDLHNIEVRLEHNTVVTGGSTIIHSLVFVPESARPGATPDQPPVKMYPSENLFELSGVPEDTFSLLLPPDWSRKDGESLSVKEAEGLLPRLLDWREERNLYCKVKSFQSMRLGKGPTGAARKFTDEPLPAFQTLADWQRLWKTSDSGSAEGVIRYKSGDVLARMKATPELITSEDFRLHPDSPGYRAGPDGKDLGADVDLVGPGPAYDRWKQTPEYQQWLKDSGQEN